MIYLLAILHALIDAACAGKLITATGGLSTAELSSWFFLYNLLAFGTQGIAGAFLDTVSQRPTGMRRRLSSGKSGLAGQYLLFAAAGSVLVVFGAAGIFSLPAAICLIGLGNSLFHVGGGGYCLSVSKRKAAGVGIFVGPGSLGLGVGFLFPKIEWIFAAGIVLAGAAVIIFGFAGSGIRSEVQDGDVDSSITNTASSNTNTDASITNIDYLVKESPDGRTLSPWAHVAMAGFLCAAVAFRAFGGSFPVYSWKTGTFAVVAAAFAVMTGKIAGGFAFDRFGAKRVIILSTCLAAPVIALLSDSAAASLAGIICLNMAMPVTLVLLYRCLPRYPGFSFGLAASILFPGSLLGQVTSTGLKQESVFVRSGFFIGCSFLALLLILVSIHLLNYPRTRKEEIS